MIKILADSKDDKNVTDDDDILDAIIK